MKIQILGTGCPKCKKLAENAETAAKTLGVEYELVKVTDINEIVDAKSGSPENARARPGNRDVHGFLQVGPWFYFVARTPDEGAELWRSQGTARTAELVKDIRPGPLSSNIAELTVLGTTLFFRADDGTHGAELWKSDGTEVGTTMVTDILTGGLGSFPAWIETLGSQIYFSARDDLDDYELWQSDGTAIGTKRVGHVWAACRTTSLST